MTLQEKKKLRKFLNLRYKKLYANLSYKISFAISRKYKLYKTIFYLKL